MLNIVKSPVPTAVLAAADTVAPDVAKRARRRAAHRIAFLGHAVVFSATVLLIAAIYVPAAVIVALAWGIGLATHGFFGVVAPVLREKWISQDLARELAVVVPRARADERRVTEDKHARDVERLAAQLAHEIRNPIAAAKSLVRQIRDDPAALEVPEYARVAEGELDRVESSVAHLLRFAREEPLRLAEVSLARVVSSALDAAAERAAGVRLKPSISDVVLEADEDKLRRAILNLVVNGADAARTMDAARREVSIEAGPSLDRSRVWVRVCDRGGGIDPLVGERVFDPWVTGKDAGTGLGLPIARKLCEAHGGTLEIERSGPDGTAMLISLPRMARKSAA